MSFLPGGECVFEKVNFLGWKAAYFVKIHNAAG